ncbi:MAG: DegT/DnrJ/EryC1/StrS family aminotransferase [Candidatus Eutrophobiaceae bacterium]
MNENLALHGGEPVRRAPFPPWPWHDEDEINAASAILRSGKTNYWNSPLVGEFEAEYARSCNRRHAIALANGSVALELALRALGIGSGDDVIVASRSFIASASAIVAVGARPVFADVDLDSQNISAGHIEAVLTPKTRAVIVVHLAGCPCAMEDIMELAREKGVFVVEDCAQAHGAAWNGKPVGSFGNAAAFSFCQDKIITTGGEGGMLLLDDDAAWKKAWAYKDHGKSYDQAKRKKHGHQFAYLCDSFGTNLRMTAMQAAIGKIQLSKLPMWLEERRRNAQCLEEGFRSIPSLRAANFPDAVAHAFYRYYVFLQPESLRAGWNRSRIVAAISAEGVPCFVGSCPEIWREKAFADAGFQPTHGTPNAKRLGELCFCFPTHPRIAKQELNDIIEATEKVFRFACP